MLYAKLYGCIAIDATIERLHSNFNGLSQYAQELMSSNVDCETNEEWDKEYNRLVPTDFYFRNVENITAEHAFHMILLQFFAKNEEWMIENELLVNGELKIYIGRAIVLLGKLLSTIEMSFEII